MGLLAGWLKPSLSPSVPPLLMERQEFTGTTRLFLIRPDQFTQGIPMQQLLCEWTSYRPAASPDKTPKTPNIQSSLLFQKGRPFDCGVILSCQITLHIHTLISIFKLGDKLHL